MLSESVIQGIFEIRKVLKEKVSNKYLRAIILLVISFVVIAPLAIFDYWVGTFVGLAIVIIIFLIIIYKGKPK